jgi:hypothetical protein
MSLVRNVKHAGCTILVSKMSDCYVKNIFDDSDNTQLPDAPYSPLGGGDEGAVEDAKGFVDDWIARGKPPR